MTAAWKTWSRPAEGTSFWDWHGGRCAWCGYEDRLVRDHCHDNGLIRGLLCYSCNSHECTSMNGEWDSWREGDNPATSLRHFEVYRPSSGLPSVNPSSPIAYYSAPEIAAWHETASESLARGEWPVIPWTNESTARRETAMESFRAAFASPRWAS